MKSSDNIEKLFQKYLSGSQTEAEFKELLDHFDTFGTQSPLRSLIGQQMESEYTDSGSLQEMIIRMDANVYQGLENRRNSERFVLRLWPRVAVAAVILLVGTAMLFFTGYLGPKSGYRNMLNAKQISAGKNSAVLTLANGKTIRLSAEKMGLLSSASDLTYTDGTAIDPGLHLGEATALIITTPRGGQYQAVLPDGTSVWLNAASSLKFPSRFTGNERVVELTGEAYFEVTKLKSQNSDAGVKQKMPFLVVSKGQKVEVLGTHFNISSYSDEDDVKTTLLEGSVRISVYPDAKNAKGSEAILLPGQQSVQNFGHIMVREVDAAYAIDWKNGKFSFKNEPLQSIMRKVARWYNVEVTYQNEQLMDRKFSGKVSRYDDVYEVLRILEMTGGAEFKIEGRKITIL
ncbi:DUF4974 domain-containing protein [Pedobacter hiemivivus]|uniref:DUF4974 domain-containing protein n=1 Tax=Pedobacter hiemivivus TaxID=2530454 RepID=A0A4U1G2I9_9SPHI|nr:FecR family protein [Pedobacter hiemivivus]TKC54982.1 DUF4974 domain-containing protein [Pedobacter hiemivivus]